MDKTSLKLSASELEIFTDPVFFQRKTQIAKVIISLLENLNLQLEKDAVVHDVNVNFNLPHTRGKISKGENYLGYPWQILDYPRVFEKENVFAFRTLCWWGNFYSCTLHIGGDYYEKCQDVVSKNLHLLKDQSFYLCVNDKQWDHHFELNNYDLLKEVSKNEALLRKILDQKFIKLSLKFPLEKIDDLVKNAMESFKLFSEVITRTSKDQ